MTVQKLDKHTFTKYEKTRIIGARALQIAMDAPLLTNISKERLEELNYDPMEMANEEFEKEVLPITVKQPMPKKKAVKIKKAVEATKEEDKDKQVEEGEIVEEKEISEEGEIMELATPEDEESFEGSAGGREGSEELQ
ncbi:MAG: DNA-directed RNA polymerase subunit K [Candidatus Pacearchaeota archaeon]|jgi:DNA-directed RNA polymerase subunit K